MSLNSAHMYKILRILTEYSLLVFIVIIAIPVNHLLTALVYILCWLTRSGALNSRRNQCLGKNITK